jgi:hypothetical protein
MFIIKVPGFYIAVPLITTRSTACLLDIYPAGIELK